MMDRFRLSNRTFSLVLLVSWMLFLAHRPILQWVDDVTTPQPWFQVSFDIPDFAPGDDPLVSYRRKINRTLFGAWFAKVSRQRSDGSYDYACGGDGMARYDAEGSGAIRMPLSDFVGRRCRWSPGTYRICTNYELRDPRGVGRSFGPFCDSFVVQPDARVLPHAPERKAP